MESTSPKQQSKVLLVEDDTNFGKVLKNYLELNDFVVELARDGILGLNAFRTEKFDICLLDVMMPNMDGFTLAEEIRNIDPEVPLFFLTAKNMKDDVSLEDKKRRVNEIIDKQRQHSAIKNQMSVGKVFRVLIEGESKKSKSDFAGRNDQSKVIVFPRKTYSKGDYVNVLVNSCTSGTLIGEIVD
jgi:CheY-like chemotaxis protein